MLYIQVGSITYNENITEETLAPFAPDSFLAIADGDDSQVKEIVAEEMTLSDVVSEIGDDEAMIVCGNEMKDQVREALAGKSVKEGRSYWGDAQFTIQ